MVSEFNITVPLGISREHLWQIRSSPTFMQFLVSNGALNRMDATPEIAHESSPTARSRRQVYIPSVINVPESLKFFADLSCLEITDTQVWDELRPFEQNFDIRPSILSDVVRTSGVLKLEENGSNRDEGKTVKNSCNHTLRGQCEVTIPLVGGLIEKAIIGNIHNFYKHYGTHIKEFVEMISNKYGDGNVECLNEAICSLLLDERKQILRESQ